jgi:hypothetical protein
MLLLVYVVAPSIVVCFDGPSANISLFSDSPSPLCPSKLAKSSTTSKKSPEIPTPMPTLLQLLPLSPVLYAWVLVYSAVVLS